MKVGAGFPLALLVVCLLLLSTLALTGGAVWLDLPAESRPILEELLVPRIGLALLLLLVICIVAGSILKWAWLRYDAAPLHMVEQLHLMLDANPQHRLPENAAPQLAALAVAVNRLADQRDALRHDVEEQIRCARNSVEEEKNRLAALMSELNQSVIVCNLDGRILLYNNRALMQFSALDENAVSLIGLGRSIFSLFNRQLITHALDNLQHLIDSKDPQPLSQFVAAMPSGQLLRVQMAPVRTGANNDAAATISGYVLMLDNITHAVENETRRDEILQKLTEGGRSSLASIRGLATTISDAPDIDPDRRNQILHAIEEVICNMSVQFDKAAADHAALPRVRWPLMEMRGADLIDALRRRLETRYGSLFAVQADPPDAGLWVRVDSFALIEAVSFLAGRLQEKLPIRLLRLRLGQEQGDRSASLDAIWTGSPFPADAVHTLESETLDLPGERSPLSLHDIMARHGGALHFLFDDATRQASLRLMIPAAGHREPPDAQPSTGSMGSRPEYYDFDLFKRSGQSHGLDDSPLSDLAYTAFDTETTGLDPSGGDEIIQIGAVRIVNGRLLRHERFDRLIDPRRALTAESIAIHGITPQLLEGQPGIEKALPAFHRFAEDTVLVAHNAAFDMRFLQLKEGLTGVRFTQPVLDTLLLSALLQPNQESHQLEAIAARFGIVVIGRHTALGDAILTGEVFLRMIPLLNAMGIRTLTEALEASRETYYARIKY